MVKHKVMRFSLGKLIFYKEKLIKPEPKEKNSNGTTYNNCVFGQPFLIQPKTINNGVDADIEKVTKYVAEKTGLNSELIERVLETANEYFGQ
jgi:hypothetical protein